MSSRCSEDSPRVVVVVVTGLRLHSYVLCCVSCVPPYLPLPAYYPIARKFWGCISTSYLARDYARVRPLSWYLVSHDGLCTILRTFIVLAIRTQIC